MPEDLEQKLRTEIESRLNSFAPPAVVEGLLMLIDCFAIARGSYMVRDALLSLLEKSEKRA